MLAKPLEPKQATGCCSHHLQQLRLPLTTLVLSRGHPLYRTEGTREHLTQRPDSSLARPGALALPAPVCARLTHPHAGVRQRLHGSLEPEPMVLRPHGQALRLSAAHSQQPRMGMADKLSPRLGHGLGPELTLLVSHGGHFEQVGALLHLRRPIQPCPCHDWDFRGVAKRPVAGPRQLTSPRLLRAGCARQMDIQGRSQVN